MAVYVFAGAAAAAAGWRERKRRPGAPDLWPAFWFGTAGLLLVMAVGRATDAGNRLTDLGRTIAQSEGWYRHRHRLQVAAVGSVGLVWLLAVATTLWRVPARRRRYLPAAVAVTSLLGFVGIRLISLHKVDTLLERRHLFGVKVGAVLELLAVLVVALATCVPVPRARAARTSAQSALR